MPAPRGLIGVIHLPAMPGDPGGGSFDAAREHARRDALALLDGGIDAVIVENFGSRPFPKGTAADPLPPHQVAAIATVAAELRRRVRVLGINCLRNDVIAALGIAAATGADFVRVNVHVGAYVTDQGIIEGRAFETLRYRRELGAEAIAILADVRVKHASPLAPVPVATEVEDCLRRAFADAVVVTSPSGLDLTFRPWVDPRRILSDCGSPGYPNRSRFV